MIKKKKYKKDGMLKGKSHKEGGIPIEAEGGEYIIKKSSVNEETEDLLNYINKNGRLPYKFGGEIPTINAKKRRK
jgi:hypothetical protein